VQPAHTPRAAAPPEITAYLACVHDLAQTWTLALLQRARNEKIVRIDRTTAAQIRRDTSFSIKPAEDAVDKARDAALECFLTRFMRGAAFSEKAIVFAATLLELFGDDLTASSGQKVLDAGMKMHVSDYPEQLSEFVERAKNGDAFADDAIRWDASRRIARGDLLPEPLRGYVIAILKHEGPRMRRGQHPHVYWIRDYDIATTIREVRRLGFQATRNREQKHQVVSACFIVAKALERVNRAMSERAVAAIWGKWGKLLET
jgi:hypothetical protein